ncbi:MAG: hypothetical protein LBF62_03965 [Tannerellaceae bacterium]|nr:hypothetical protein [Tannerellaceae bacterium]
MDLITIPVSNHQATRHTIFITGISQVIEDDFILYIKQPIHPATDSFPILFFLSSVFRKLSACR